MNNREYCTWAAKAVIDYYIGLPHTLPKSRVEWIKDEIAMWHGLIEENSEQDVT